MTVLNIDGELLPLDRDDERQRAVLLPLLERIQAATARMLDADDAGDEDAYEAARADVICAGHELLDVTGIPESYFHGAPDA